jgi:tRNA G18 (ribose-2'-O)-methylase SpoU
MGALFRSALASGYKKVILIDSVCPYLPKVTRGSMGYNFKLDIREFSMNEFIDYTKSNNLYLICGNLNGEDVFTFTPKSKPYGVVIGNEGNGLSSTMQNMCTDTVTIPMQNQVESLNASVSGSILMYVLNQKIKGE